MKGTGEGESITHVSDLHSSVENGAILLGNTRAEEGDEFIHSRLDFQASDKRCELNNPINRSRS